jgi:hypothetical protein
MLQEMRVVKDGADKLMEDLGLFLPLRGEQLYLQPNQKLTSIESEDKVSSTEFPRMETHF